MSSPNHFDIPAAILLKNPGINKYEFQELLNQVHIGCRRNGTNWHETRVLDGADNFFHFGLYSLANMLQLNSINGLEHSHCEIRFNDEVFPLIKRGANDIFLDPFFLVNKEKKYRRTPIRKKRYLETIREVMSLEKMFEIRPELNPEIAFDWSKKQGLFHRGARIDRHSWGWYQKNGKYYLMDQGPSEVYDELWVRPNGENAKDENGNIKSLTYESEGTVVEKRKSPAEFDPDENIYSSVVVSASAIENKAWSLFGRNGFQLLDLFFKEFPDSQVELAKSHRAYWVSQYAKKNALSHTDLCRLSAEMGPVDSSWVVPLYDSIWGKYRRKMKNSSNVFFDGLPSVESDKDEKIYPPQEYLDIHPRVMVNHTTIRRDGFPKKEFLLDSLGMANADNFPYKDAVISGVQEFFDCYGKEGLPDEWKNINFLPF